MVFSACTDHLKRVRRCGPGTFRGSRHQRGSRDKVELAMSIPLQRPDPETLSDPDLVALARQRDEGAVRAITRRYNRRLYRVARGILRNDSEAEDVVQETYVR